MQQHLIEQLYAEVYQCQVLLHSAADRLALLCQTIRQLQAGADLPADAALPPATSAANLTPDDLPPGSLAANLTPIALPINRLAANMTPEALPPAPLVAKLASIPLPPIAVAANLVPSAPSPRQLIRVLKQQVFVKTTGLHLRRTAELMLLIRQHPGVPRGVAPYAELLGMSYGGAAKFVMQTCRKGLIKRTAFKVYALTAQGEAYVQEALLPVKEE